MRLTQSEDDSAYIFVAIKTPFQACSWIFARLCTCGRMGFISLGLNIEVLMLSCVKDDILWVLHCTCKYVFIYYYQGYSYYVIN